MIGHRLDPILKLVGYCHEFLRGAHGEARGRLHLRRGAARRGYLDVVTLVAQETLLFDEAGALIVSPAQESETEVSLDDIGTEFENLESENGDVSEAELPTMTTQNGEETPFDALRRLNGLVQGHPHEMECIYGLLFLEGNDARGRPILAPLVTAPVSIRYDGAEDAIRIECEHDYARLNTYVISELMADTYDAMAETLRELAQLPLPLDPGSVQRVLRTLQTVSGMIDVPRELLNEAPLLRILERQGPVSDLLPPGRFRLRRYAALAVVRRGNVFVLDDLGEMTKLDPESFEGSLLARFALAEEGFNGGDGERLHSLLGHGEILFPFAANDRQMQVAQAIERHGLIRVQGPPGTGKSQTIANLVCHLVARGKRVLVTSQQQKAVEVVEGYLEKLGIDFLPMTLLKGDRDATRTLKSRLDGLVAFMFDRSMDELRRKGQAAEQKVAGLRQQMLDLEAELGRSLVFEATLWGATGKTPGELAAEYTGCRGHDRMAEGEIVTWEKRTEAGTLLSQVVDLTREFKGRRLELAQLCESTNLPDNNDIESLLQDVLAIRDVLYEEARLCPRAEAIEIRTLPLFPVRAGCTPEEAEALKEVLARQMRRLAALAGRERGRLTIASTAGYDQAACHADLESLQEFLEALPQLRQLEENATGCEDGGVEPKQLAEALEVCETGRARWLSRLFPAFRRSRRVVAAALGRERLTRVTDISPVRARVDAYRLRMRLAELRTRRLSHLHVPEIPAHFDLTSERRLVGLCSVAKEALQARDAACELSTAIATTLGHDVGSDMLIEHGRVSEMHEQVERIRRELGARRVGQKARALVEKWGLSTRGGPLQVLADAVETGDPEKAYSIVSYLELNLPLVPGYRALLALLGGPLTPWRATAEAWIRQSEEEEATDFHEAITCQVHARALRTELYAADQAAPRESIAIAEECRHIEERYRVAAREAVEAYLHARIVEAYSKAAIGNEVRSFSKILQRGKRNYEAFLTLKRRPRTFESVLSVLPCWLATIEDVARVFPLGSRLFDVVIVDEASQCSIPSALPLFARSQKAIVVGDDKQLPCVEGKFVSRAYNAELINRHQLFETLPRPENFNACESSLFDLAGSFTEQPVFLAEHFRCHPDIIAFSNKRFYDDRLIILTHGMDRSRGAPTEVIPVSGASDDPQAKVNRKEAEAVVRKLRVLINDSRYEGLDFGVCSPFRNQADLIWELILAEFTDREIQERKLVSATADGFQGDERDVILYSFRFAPNSSPRIFTLSDGSEGQQRMNVAFTRPRRRALCFISHSVENFPPGLVRDFLRHAANPATSTLNEEPWDSRFERDVHAFLESKGLEVRPQVRACGYRLDFVLRGPNGHPAALEADGWEIHYPDGRLREEDIQRQRVLERAGWTVFRVHSRAFYRDPEGALAHVLDFFAMDEVPEGRGETVCNLTEVLDASQRAEDAVEALGAARERERVDPAKIPLQEIQEALRSVAPEPGVEIKRDELFRRALPHVGRQRLTEPVRERFKSALRGLIQRGEFGYRGQDVVWRLKITAEHYTRTGNEK